MVFIKVENILNEIGASEFLAVFKEYYIDDDVLPCISNKDDLPASFPWGLKLRFLNALNSSSASRSTSSASSVDVDASLNLLSESQSTSSESSIDVVNSSSLSLSQATSVLPHSSHLLSQPVGNPIENTSIQSVEFSLVSNKELDLILPISEATPVELANNSNRQYSEIVPNSDQPITSNIPPTPSLHSSELIQSPSPSQKKLKITSGASLKDALQKFAQGHIVLKAYDEQQFLDKSQSLLLCDVILTHEFGGYPDTRLKTADFMSLSQSIKDLFPKEKTEAYYSRFRQEGGVQTPAKGRLLDKYENRRKSFRNVGLISSAKRKSAGQTTTFSSVADDTVNKAIEWFELNNGPVEQAKERWSVLHNYRFESLLRKETKTSIQTYFDRWPVLRILDIGSSLIELDFHLLHPEQEKNFINNWGEVAEKILIFANKKVEKDSNFKISVEQANIDINIQGPENRKISALLVLPLLFNAPGNVNRNRKNVTPWKPSKAESVEGFILRASDSGSYESKLLTKRGFYSAREISFQPLTIIVGPIENVTQTLVVIDEIKFSFNTVLEAFDFCFKSFFSLNACYQVESVTAYTFIQHAVYKIGQKHNGRDFRAVNDLINQLRLDE